MACRADANSNNFLLWQSVTDQTLAQLQASGLPDICNHTSYTDQYSNVNNQVNYLIAGEAFNFYANLDTMPTSANFASWELRILHDNDFVVVHSFGAMTKDAISGSSYRFYSSLTVPTGLTHLDCYYLAVIDTADSNAVKYISKYPLQARDDKRNAFHVRYRNDISILNYNYTGSLNAFYNTFWVELAILQPAYPTTRIGYTKIEGDFKQIRTLLGETKQFITRDYNADMHKAFKAAILHKTFQVYELGNWTQYKLAEGQEYDIGWNDEFPLAHGEIGLERTSSFSSNKAI